MKNTGVTNEKIMSFLVEMDERVTNIDERLIDVSKHMATKEDLEMLRQDIREELKPISNAVDRDGRTIINYGKRITVLERRGGIATK